MVPAALVTQPIPIFFIVLAIILLAPLLLNRLKIPHIIGMIVAGMIVGPYGFDILQDDSSFAIFGQVGLLYLMFLAGLEIDMYHLRLNLRRGLLFGILTLFIPLGLGILTSMLVLRLDLTTSLLLGAMYAAHTLISYPVAARYEITKSQPVLIAIVGTIIAVVGSLLVIASAVTIKRDGYFNPVALAWLLCKITLWTVAIVWAYPRLTRWFFKTYSDRVTQYVYCMCLVFLAAWTAQIVGLEGVLGAFVAGLVLNRFVPAASPLMASTEFVGNALFIPYFLISVGMMINLRVVVHTDTLTVAGIMLGVALVSKWIPAFVTERINKLGRPGGRVLFGLTTAHTAVALAVVTLGYKMGMLSEVVLNSTILVILVTCAVAPIFTAAGAASLRISMLDQDEMIRTNRTNNTLIAVANPLMARGLVELGLLMRNDRGAHRFYAIHVRNENSRAARNLSHESLETAEKTAAAVNIPLTGIERFDLNTVTGILNALPERDITEVIVGMHRRSNVIDSFFGKKVEQLLKATNRMVIISRCYIPLNTVSRIIVAVPRGAQYETGFSRWVRGLARLTRQLGCRIIFCCHADVQPLIRGVIYHENYGIRCEFRTTDSYDEFILLSGRINPDDLMVVISARPNSVSYTEEVTEMPSLLQRNFAGFSLIVIYPEQFGEEVTLTSFSDPMAADLSTAQSALTTRLWALLRSARALLNRWFS
ncbi:MAG: cation:proton antiporter [Muribaculaceae bacterium]|nr:cation:proton antiporter [Muribaculaceae bacterium]